MGDADGLGHQPRLADARLARDQDETAVAPADVLPGRQQRVQLRCASGEGEDLRRLDHLRQRQHRLVDRRGPDHLAHRHGPGKPFELARTKGTDLLVRPGTGQRPDKIADQDLAALGHRAQPRRLDHRRTEPVPILERGIPPADPDPHRLRRSLPPPVVPLDRPLHRHRTGQGISRPGIRGHQRVADGLHLGPPGGHQRLPQTSEVGPAQLIGSNVTDLGPLAGRVDQIREEDQDQPGATHRSLPSPQASPYCGQHYGTPDHPATCAPPGPTSVCAEHRHPMLSTHRTSAAALAALARHDPVRLVYLATCAVLTSETPGRTRA